MLSAAAAFIWAVEHQVHIAFVLKSGTLVLRLIEGVVPDELLLVVADSLTDTDDLTEIAADIMPDGAGGPPLVNFAGVEAQAQTAGGAIAAAVIHEAGLDARAGS